VTSTLTIQPTAYCLIDGNQVYIQQPFYSNGYYPLQDGQLAFTLKNILVNGETNSLYGSFFVQIYDYPNIIAYQEFVSQQMIMPLQMMYSSTQILSSANIPQQTIMTGNQDLSFVLSFNTTYMVHTQSRFYITFPSKI
jgi:hypothetical protein